MAVRVRRWVGANLLRLTTSCCWKLVVHPPLDIAHPRLVFLSRRRSNGGKRYRVEGPLYAESTWRYGRSHRVRPKTLTRLWEILPRNGVKGSQVYIVSSRRTNEPVTCADVFLGMHTFDECRPVALAHDRPADRAVSTYRSGDCGYGRRARVIVTVPLVTFVAVMLAGAVPFSAHAWM
jgi:hypothetical protein